MIPLLVALGAIALFFLEDSSPRWKGKLIVPSKAAYKELAQLGLGLDDVVDILENGFDCARSKRAAGTIEKCFRKGKRLIKVVVVDYSSREYRENVWLVTHVG